MLDQSMISKWNGVKGLHVPEAIHILGFTWEIRFRHHEVALHDGMKRVVAGIIAGVSMAHHECFVWARWAGIKGTSFTGFTPTVGDVIRKVDGAAIAKGLTKNRLTVRRTNPPLVRGSYPRYCFCIVLLLWIRFCLTNIFAQPRVYCPARKLYIIFPNSHGTLNINYTLCGHSVVRVRIYSSGVLGKTPQQPVGYSNIKRSSGRHCPKALPAR